MTTTINPALSAQDEIIGLLKAGASPAAVAVGLRFKAVAPDLIHYFMANIPAAISGIPEYLPDLIYQDRVAKILGEVTQKSAGQEAALSDVAAYLFPAHVSASQHRRRGEWEPLYTHAVRATLSRHNLPRSCRKDFRLAKPNVTLSTTQEQLLGSLRRQLRSRLVRETRERLIVMPHYQWTPPEGDTSFREMFLQHWSGGRNANATVIR